MCHANELPARCSLPAATSSTRAAGEHAVQARPCSMYDSDLKKVATPARPHTSALQLLQSYRHFRHDQLCSQKA